MPSVPSKGLYIPIIITQFFESSHQQAYRNIKPQCLPEEVSDIWTPKRLCTPACFFPSRKREKCARTMPGRDKPGFRVSGSGLMAGRAVRTPQKDIRRDVALGT